MRAFRELLKAVVIALALLSGACSAVTEQYVVPDFEKVHRMRVWRVHAQAKDVAQADEQVGKLWVLIAQRWVNHHRDYIVKTRSVDARTHKELCEGELAGVLVITPHFTRVGDDAEVKASAALLDCRDGKAIWKAQAEGSWAVKDDELETTTARYAKELGEEIRPWVPATFRLLRELLDTMPRPKLKDDDAIMEKIELEE